MAKGMVLVLNHKQELGPLARLWWEERLDGLCYDIKYNCLSYCAPACTPHVLDRAF